MELFLFGLSHKTAPVEIREQFTVGPAQLPRTLQHLREAGGVREAVIVSTCNRTEIYALGPATAEEHLERYLGNFHPALRAGMTLDELRQFTAPTSLSGEFATRPSFLYHRNGAEAVRHLFRVGCGLDSLVIGESEILGQVKTAFEASRTHGALGTTLDELFRRAISCGKRARTETAIGRGALNIGSAAVELARQIFGPLSGHTVFILGAGKMSALTAQHLVASGAKRIVVANRTHERALELAARFAEGGAQAEAVTWDEFPRRLADADIVIASTGADHHVLAAEQVAAAMKSRRQRPLFLIDIAVPRDIDPEAHQLDEVFLYDIDDLQGVVASNLAQRSQEIARVEAIIESELESWTKWHGSRAAQPIAAALAREAGRVRDAEVEAALARLSHLGPREQEIVRALGHAITQKLIHPPLRHLREAGDLDDADALRRAFGLEAQSNTGSEEAPPAPGKEP
jgi:glutamyl-tRNA reductase